MAQKARADVFSKAKRSEVMSRIGGKNTKPELQLRRALFALGLRYRLHVKNLPGSPDLVFPRYRVVVFVNGCFWHQHSCRLFQWPKGNRAFWHRKLIQNVRRDQRVRRQLRKLGWRAFTISECQIRGRSSRLPALASRLSARLKG